MDYRYSDRMANLSGTATREIFKLLSRPEIISFAGGLPATECLPVKEIAQITAELWESEDAVPTLQYGTTEGFPALRERFIDYVKTVGIENAALDETLVVSGGQQTIDLMCKTFLDKGDVVLVEDPTYLAVLQIINSYEGKAIGVKADKDGLDIDDLEDKIIQYKPKFLYVVPTFSNPTGKTYTTSNRKDIARITAKYNVMVLEDDPYSKLRFEGSPVPGVKSFDTAGNVVFTASISKIIAPGLRTGIAVGDKQVIRKLSICKQGTDLHTNNVAQMIVARYLEKGYLMPNIEKSLPLYIERRDAMLEAIDRFMPAEFTHTVPQGGLFIWGAFDADVDTVKILPEAVEKNVAYIQGQVFFADGGGLNTLRLNYSNSSPEKIQAGIKALGTLYKKKIAEAK